MASSFWTKFPWITSFGCTTSLLETTSFRCNIQDIPKPMIKCAFWLHLLTGFWPELRVLGTVSEYETASFGYKKFLRSTSFRYTTSENPLFLYGFHNFPLDYPQAYPQHAISLWITIIPPVSKTRITYLKLVLHAPRTRKSCPQNSQFLLKLVDNPLILLDFRATARSLIYRLILFVF